MLVKRGQKVLMASCSIYIKRSCLIVKRKILLGMFARYAKLFPKLLNNCCSTSCSCIVLKGKRKDQCLRLVTVQVSLDGGTFVGSFDIKFWLSLFFKILVNFNQSPNSFSSISCKFFSESGILFKATSRTLTR